MLHGGDAGEEERRVGHAAEGRVVGRGGEEGGVVVYGYDAAAAGGGGDGEDENEEESEGGEEEVWDGRHGGWGGGKEDLRGEEGEVYRRVDGYIYRRCRAMAAISSDVVSVSVSMKLSSMKKAVVGVDRRSR